MKAGDILKQVLQTLETRGKENGYDQKEERSADSIADIFNAISDKEFAAADVWSHMVALKLARLKSQIMNGSDVTDSIVDLIGYAALLGEELTKVPDAVKAVYRTDAVMPSNKVMPRAATETPAVDGDGWVSWGGGACPVKNGTLVDVEYRDGARGFALPASKLSNNSDPSLERSARKEFWENDGIASDIVKYRLAKDLVGEENTADGWVDWDGGDCPHALGDHDVVEIFTRDGCQATVKVGDVLWRHYGELDDVVKYRVL